MYQRDIFLNFEANNWYKRNKASSKLETSDIKIISKYASLKKGGKLLEIGCSSGRKLNEYSTNIVSGYGIDPSEEAIAEGKNLYPHLNLKLGVADSLPFPENFFDVVVFGFCLYLIDRSLLIKVISEAERVLKNKSFLIITDFDTKYPCKRKYHHLKDQNIFSYKMSYEKLFLIYPHYLLIEKIPCINEESFVKDVLERVATTVLYKDLSEGYVEIA